jgi:ribosome silencing factor RsfS/YbeB/iojap
VPFNTESPNSKLKGRKQAVANPEAAGKKTVAKHRAKPKAKVAGKPKLAGRPKLAGKPKPADKRKAAKLKPSLKTVVINALDDMKALEIKVLDVRGLTDIADWMVIASGTSDRHVRSVAQRVVERTKEAGFRPHGVEGQQDGDWVLIDLNEMIVHVMLPRVREFYGLEKLWDMTATKRAARA